MVVFASFEDSIYIVLGLVWVIYSAYNAKKKKNAKKNPTHTPKNKSFLDSIITELGLPTEQPEPVLDKLDQNDENQFDDAQSEIIPIDEPQKIFSYDDEYENSNYVPPFNLVENEAVVNHDKGDPTIDRITEELTENVHINKKKKSIKRIDLRRAVIYSEILKKVYF